MDLIPLQEWQLSTTPLAPNRPFLISGPCSAETRDQVLTTCTQIASMGVQLLRAGIWKPRTRPGSFEGLGKVALPWLKEAGAHTGLPICCEVATPSHVEAALEAGVDVLWIGARTTVNPFAVQDIADALVGVDVPVFVKNPVNPDLELWIGALERIHGAGIRRLGAVHRGFSVYNAPKYRNQPQWDIPIELRRRLPQLPLINDPSHIAGKRALLYEIAQNALDLHFDGLMIESHITPETAWSDSAQQVTPEGLDNLLNRLVLRQLDSDNTAYLHSIQEWRSLIDQLDTETLQLLSRRMEAVRQIGWKKKERNIAVLQIERWLHVRQSALTKAKDAGLSETFVEALINVIHKESIRQQTVIMRKE